MSFVESTKYHVDVRKLKPGGFRPLGIANKNRIVVEGKTMREWAKEFDVSVYTMRRIVQKYNGQNLTMLEMKTRYMEQKYKRRTK